MFSEVAWPQPIETIKNDILAKIKQLYLYENKISQYLGIEFYTYICSKHRTLKKIRKKIEHVIEILKYGKLTNRYTKVLGNMEMLEIDSNNPNNNVVSI